MPIDVEVNNKTKSPIADGFFAAVAEEAIGKTGYAFLREKNISISVALVSEEEMQALNKKHRHKDSVTDILSFFEYENIGEIENVAENDLFLGELILCYDDIHKYAQKQGIGLQKELANVTAHGVLHLLGFSHGEEMFGIQDKVVKKF
ncbi:MAG: rRNA maturation RNase YbeY [Candidatus Moranbacteria bacterium]|nr:rRNA maturation RNase YbeY [Candidatus Moranbacteria bacterium]